VLALTAAIMGLASAAFCELSLSARHNPVVSPPSPTTNTSGQVETVHLETRDNIKLAAWFAVPSRHSGRCVVVLHGIADTKAGAAGFGPMFLDHGYSVLTPDSRGHGESEGDFVTYGLLEKYDVVEWARWLHTRGCDHVYGLGESLGGAILIQAASLTGDFSAIVAESSYSDLRSIAVYRLARMLHLPASIRRPVASVVVSGAMIYARLRYGFDLNGVSPIISLPRISVPVLLIHGEEDSQTPASNSIAMAQVDSRVVLWLVPKAGHVGAFAAEPSEFRSRVLEWFAAH
jgi:uncharacterized protein